MGKRHMIADLSRLTTDCAGSAQKPSFLLKRHTCDRPRTQSRKLKSAQLFSIRLTLTSRVPTWRTRVPSNSALLKICPPREKTQSGPNVVPHNDLRESLPFWRIAC